MRRAAFLLLFAALVSAAGELRVGRASLRITPETGTPMGSSYGLTISTGVHDDLYIKTLALEKDGVRTALVACDLISLRPGVVAEARKLIQQSAGLNPEQVILSATHSHCGPQMHRPFLELLDAESLRLGVRFREQLPQRISDCVRQAFADLRPALASVGIGKESSISFNRRFHMKDGSVRMNPGRRNPDAIRPAAGIDPNVNVVYFTSTGGEPLATHVNFAMHPAIAGGSEFSADYPGVLASLLRKVKGGGMLSLFTMGTAGDINHLDVSKEKQLSNHDETSRVGMVLTGEVLKTYTKLQPVDGALGVARTTLHLPAREPREGEDAKARDIFSRYRAGRGGPPFQDVVWAWRTIETAALEDKHLSADVQVISLGDQLAWVALPGEIFVDLGLAIKKASPFPYTIISTMSASGTISYVPTRKAFAEGSYEVTSARIAAGGGEMLVDAAVRLLKKLKAEAR